MGVVQDVVFRCAIYLCDVRRVSGYRKTGCKWRNDETKMAAVQTRRDFEE